VAARSCQQLSTRRPRSTALVSAGVDRTRIVQVKMVIGRPVVCWATKLVFVQACKFLLGAWLAGLVDCQCRLTMTIQHWAGPTFYFVASQINRTPGETDVADRHSEDSMHDSGSTNYLLHASRSPPRINSGALLRRHLVPTHPPLTAPFILGKRYAGRKPCSHASPALLSAV
jgi:hypothetical protein